MNIYSIRAEIIRKYGSLNECAKKLGIAQTTFSRNLKNPSFAFIVRLKQIGVEIKEDDIIRENKEHYGTLPNLNLGERISNLENELLLLKNNNLEKENAKLKEELAAMNDKIVQLSAQLTLLGELNKKIKK